MITVSLFLLLLIAPSGCQDESDGIEASVPKGFEALSEWGVRHQAVGVSQGGFAIDAQTPLLDPWSLRVVPPGPLGEGSALYVAERNGWRILRFGVESVSPVSLGEPSVVVSAESWVSGAAFAPFAFGEGRPDDLFGRVMAVSLDETVIFSGPAGELWVSAPGWARAHLLGAGPLGEAPDDGVEVGAADLTRVAGVAFDEGGGGRAASVLVVTHEAVFSFESEGLSDPSVTMTRVLGSGARGQASTGTPALEAPLDLIDTAPVATDGEGNLFLLETDAGRVLSVPGYHLPGAQVLRVAGFGRVGAEGGDPTAPENRPLDIGIARHLDINKAGGRLHLDFLNLRGVPWRATLMLEGGDPVSMEVVDVDASYERTIPAISGGVTVAGDLVIAGHNDLGSLVSVPVGGDIQAPETHLFGPGGEGVTIDKDFLPSVWRPGPVLTMPVNDIPHLIMADLASSHVMRELPDGSLNTFIFRGGGVFYDRYRTLTGVPSTRTETRRLLLGTLDSVDVYDVEQGGKAKQLIDSDIGSLSLSGLPLGAFGASEAPLVVGAFGNGKLLFFDKSTGSLFTLPGDEALEPGTELTRHSGGPEARVLPLSKSSGRLVLDLGEVSEVAFGASEFLTAVMTDTPHGDLVLAVRQGSDPQTASLVGRTFDKADHGLIVAGGGARVPETGLLATEVGFNGVVSSLVTAEGALWLSLRGPLNTGLVRVSPDGVLDLVADPRRQPVLGDLEEGPVPLSSLVLGGEARIVSPGCLPAGVALLLSEGGVWWLNVGAVSSRGPTGNPLGAGEALKVRASAARQAICWTGSRLALLDAEGTSVTLPETGRVISLPGAAVSSLTVSASGQVMAASELSGVGVLLVGDAEALQRGESGPLEVISGRTPSTLDGRRLRKAGLADELPVFSGASDGLLYGASEGVLFRIHPGDSGFDINDNMEVLWTGEPLGDGRPTALAAEPGQDPVRLLIAARGRLYRFSVDASRPPEGAQVHRGHFELLGGGGDSYPGLGGPARSALMPMIEGIVPDGDRIWLRWGGYVGFIDAEGTLMGIAGGGVDALGEAVAPWSLSLSPEVGFHPALAMAPDGTLVTPAPRQGAYLGFRP